jgi:hypothetical protein
MANAWDPTGGLITLKDYAILYKGSKFGTMANMVSQVNSIMQDMPMKVCNSDDGQTYTSTALVGNPSPSIRRINEGIDPTKSDFAQSKDACAVWENMSQVDEMLTKGRNSKIVRLEQAPGIIEGFQQSLTSDLLYTNTNGSIAGSSFKGLTSRYNSGTGSVKDSVISCGGTGNDNTSVWLVCWGENTVFGIHPEGTSMGLDHEDRGKQMLEDPNGKKYFGYVDTWRQYAGMHVKDWRYVKRICNIDVSDLKNASGTQAITTANVNLLINRMREAIDSIPSQGMGRYVFYAHRVAVSAMRKQCAITKSPDFTNYVQSYEQVTPLSPGAIASNRNAFAGIPIGIVDQLLLTESSVPVV